MQKKIFIRDFQAHFPEISVLMAVYNETEKKLQDAIKSIISQTYANFEFIIILDNPKNINAQKIVNNFREKDTRIRVIENKKNIGLGRSLNKVIPISKGKYIARMDADDISDNRRLEKQLKYLKDHPKVDLLFTNWVEIDERGNTALKQINKNHLKNLKKDFFTYNPLLHATLFTRKEILEKNKYPINGRPEDLILWLSLIRKGFNFDILEEVLHTYNITQYNLEQRYSKFKEYSLNYLLALLKNCHYYWTSGPYWKLLFLILVTFIITRNKQLSMLYYKVRLLHEIGKSVQRALGVDMV